MIIQLKIRKNHNYKNYFLSKFIIKSFIELDISSTIISSLLGGSNCFSYSYSTLRINKNERKRK
jgi:hypothetical protein